MVSHCATPPCPEQVPVRCFECENMPSLHLAVAPAALLSSGAPEPPVAFEVLEVVVRELVVRVAAAGGAGAGAGAGAVVAAAAAIPP